MTTATAHYKKSPVTLSPDEMQELANLQLEDEPALVFDGDDDFEIPKTPPDNGEWLEVLLACPYPFEIPPRSKELPPPPLEM